MRKTHFIYTYNVTEYINTHTHKGVTQYYGLLPSIHKQYFLPEKFSEMFDAGSLNLGNV